MREKTSLFQAGLGRYLTWEQMDILANACVGIAGAGGLGSNAAMLLARSGVGNMLLVDHDVVDHSNLNRQHYWPEHVGQPKARALAANLLALNENMQVRALELELNAANLGDVLGECPIWLEAMDDPQNKSMFVERALLADRFVISASGICGIGGEPMRKKRVGRLIQVGDFITGQDKAPPMAPRVVQAAAMMADSVLELLLGRI